MNWQASISPAAPWHAECCFPSFLLSGFSFSSASDEQIHATPTTTPQLGPLAPQRHVSSKQISGQKFTSFHEKRAWLDARPRVLPQCAQHCILWTPERCPEVPGDDWDLGPGQDLGLVVHHHPCLCPGSVGFVWLHSVCLNPKDHNCSYQHKSALVHGRASTAALHLENDPLH